MRINHRTGWTPAQDSQVLETLDRRTGSIGAAARKASKTLNRTAGAIQNRYNILRKKSNGNGTKEPVVIPVSAQAFNDHIKKVEEITGHPFSPAEILEVFRTYQP